jgi:hypothetical protein
VCGRHQAVPAPRNQGIILAGMLLVAELNNPADGAGAATIVAHSLS